MYGNNMGKNESQTVFLNTQTSLTFDLPVLKSSTTTKYENQEIIFPLETSRLVPRALAMLFSSGHFLLSICHAGAAFIENDDWSQAQNSQDSACCEVQGVDHF